MDREDVRQDGSSKIQERRGVGKQSDERPVWKGQRSGHAQRSPGYPKNSSRWDYGKHNTNRKLATICADIYQYVTTPKQEAAWVKMRSVTEQAALDEFLSTAELAGTDFTAEKMNNVKIIHRDQKNPYLLSDAEERIAVKKQNANKERLTVPRRPKWDENTTAMELDERERESLLEWRRGLAELQESNDLLMTPFERNLEVWRQLWRVIERSDLVVQIVDARHPLLFRSEDLERYVKEVDPKKNNLLLVNKADMMTLEQRQAWADYFEGAGIDYRFFSAELAKETNEARGLFAVDEEEEPNDEDEEEESDGDLDEQLNEDDVEEEISSSDSEAEGGAELVDAARKLRLNMTSTARDIKEPLDPKNDDEEAWASDDEGFHDHDIEEQAADESRRTRILTTEDLEALFLENSPERGTEEDGTVRKTQIGLVGYPNVGKSSTINALIGAKKVSVSSTPGKTKHFQTIHLSDAVILCDCPGLVFPNFATTKAELVCNGILPIDQLREYTGPAALVAQRIPRAFLEAIYGMKIDIRPLEEGGTGTPTGEEVLRAYASARGFSTQGLGQPDESRAARYVLKDYVRGKLLFCHPPPHEPAIDGADFNRNLYDAAHLPEHRRVAWKIHDDTLSIAGSEAASTMAGSEILIGLPSGRKTDFMDQKFFARGQGNAGHLSVPVQQQSMSAGKQLSGRKLKEIVALEKDVNPADLKMNSKKHFKANKRRGKSRTEYT